MVVKTLITSTNTNRNITSYSTPHSEDIWNERLGILGKIIKLGTVPFPGGEAPSHQQEKGAEGEGKCIQCLSNE